MKRNSAVFLSFLAALVFGTVATGCPFNEPDVTDPPPTVKNLSFINVPASKNGLSFVVTVWDPANPGAEQATASGVVAGTSISANLVGAVSGQDWVGDSATDYKVQIQFGTDLEAVYYQWGELIKGGAGTDTLDCNNATILVPS